MEETNFGEWYFFEEPDEYYHFECSKCKHWLLPGLWNNKKNPISEGFIFCPYCGTPMK